MYRLLPPQDAKYRAMKRAPAAPFLLTLALTGALLGASVARADSPTVARDGGRAARARRSSSVARTAGRPSR